ncbi:class I SAM-dependent methyltransferase [Candidatus Nitrospira bockiana]
MRARAPYDLIAEKWSRERGLSGFREKPYVDRFLDLVEPGAHLLDLGCGTGTPIARYLLDRGHRVTGVDSSREMLRLARMNCPEADLIAGDLSAIDLSHRYDGIVAWDSIFHVPRAQHGTLFHQMHEWVRPGAPVLLSVGGREDEFIAPMFEVDFFYSGHAPDVSAALLREAGFEILLSEVDDPSSRGHVAVLCRKAVQISIAGQKG